MRGSLVILGLTVLQILDFIKHGKRESGSAERRNVVAQDAVGGHQHLGPPKRAFQIPLAAVIGGRLQGRRVFVDLVHPMADDSGGANDKKRLFAFIALPERDHQRHGLVCLAQSHVVAKQAREAVLVQETEPVDSFDLIRT